jgi:hypothetical protein
MMIQIGFSESHVTSSFCCKNFAHCVIECIAADHDWTGCCVLQRREPQHTAHQEEKSPSWKKQPMKVNSHACIMVHVGIIERAIRLLLDKKEREQAVKNQEIQYHCEEQQARELAGICRHL